MMYQGAYIMNSFLKLWLNYQENIKYYKFNRSDIISLERQDIL